MLRGEAEVFTAAHESYERVLFLSRSSQFGRADNVVNSFALLRKNASVEFRENARRGEKSAAIERVEFFSRLENLAA